MSYIPPVDQVATFSISANATSGGALTGLNGASVGTLHVTSIPSATLQVQVSGDGVNWINVTGGNVVMNAATGAYLASGNITAVGIYQLDIAGFAGVRVITTAFTTGPVTGTVRASTGAGSVAIDGVPSVNVSTLPALPAGANLAGKFNVASQTTGGATSFRLISAATTNATNIKASAGTLYALSAFNNGASAAYLKIYNKATAPTVGTDTPVATIMIPASGGVVLSLNDIGMALGTGIGYAITGAMADADTTAVAAAQVAVNGLYA